MVRSSLSVQKHLSCQSQGGNAGLFRCGRADYTTPDTITLTSANGGQLFVNESLTITGTGTNLLSLSGGGNVRLFFLNQGTVNLSDLTLSSGRCQGGNGGGSGGGGAGMGGALFINNGTVTVSDIAFTNNQASGGNGGSGGFGGGGGGGGSDLFILARAEGTDTVQDFQDGSDCLGLAGGLTFGQLSIARSGSNTLIRTTDSNELLASLTGVNANLITAADFTAV